MDFQLNKEQRTLQESVKKLLNEKLIPIAEKEGENDFDICWDIWNIMAEKGLIGAYVPEEYGGASRPGFESLRIVLIREQLAHCSLAELPFTVNGLGSYPIVVGGTEQQKKKYLPLVAKGKKLCSFALTEPSGGSDAAAILTTAVRDGDSYVLNGHKTFISNAGISDVYVVFAKTDPSAGHKGISAFIVEKGTKGFECGNMTRLMDPHPIGELHFNDCRVSKDSLLGKEGEGFKIAMKVLDVFRQTVGAFAVGIAQRALDLAVEYSKERVAFGKPISAFQGIQFKLADMAASIAASRLLVYQAAWLKDNGFPFSKEASIAKLFATEAAQKVVYDAQQVFGGYGVVKGYQIEKLYRQIRACQMYEGTSEIQRLVISRHLLKE